MTFQPLPQSPKASQPDSVTATVSSNLTSRRQRVSRASRWKVPVFSPARWRQQRAKPSQGTFSAVSLEQRAEKSFAWTLLGHFLSTFALAKVFRIHLRPVFPRGFTVEEGPLTAASPQTPRSGGTDSALRLVTCWSSDALRLSSSVRTGGRQCTLLTDACRRLSVRGAVWKLSGFLIHNSSSMGIQGKRRSGDGSCISVAAVSQSLSEALAQGEQRLFCPCQEALGDQIDRPRPCHEKS
jgi:hypothetical protein